MEQNWKHTDIRIDQQMTLDQIRALLFNRRDRLGSQIELNDNVQLSFDLPLERLSYKVLTKDMLANGRFYGGGTYYPPKVELVFVVHNGFKNRERIEFELVRAELEPSQILQSHYPIIKSRPWTVVEKKNGDVEFRRQLIAIELFNQDD